MVRIVEIIGLGALVIAAGFGGFKLRELFGNLTGENITSPIQDAVGGIGDAVSNIALPSISNPVQGPVQQEVVSQSFTNVEPDQRTPFDALGAGLGALFAGFAGRGEPEQPPAIEAFIPTDLGNRPLDLTQLASQQESIPQAQLNQGGFQGLATEAPIGALSLGRIIERFDVTASQAADIQARAQDNFGNFDFGTNTGSGIGSVIAQPDINEVVSRGNVSNPEFEGLTATEIAQRLTGGNINNF